MYKTLIKISTNEYVRYLDGSIYTCKTPFLLDGSVTIEMLQAYAEKFDNAKPDLSDTRMIDVEIKHSIQ